MTSNEDHGEDTIINHPLKIRKIFIKGNKRVRPEVIQHEVMAATKGSSLGEIATAIHFASQNLLDRGVFESVEIVLDASPPEFLNQTDVTVKIKEKGLISAEVGTFNQNGEWTAESSGILRSPLGWGETLSMTASAGQVGSKALRVELSQPKMMVLPASLRVLVHSGTTNHERYSSFIESQRGLRLSLASLGKSHQFEYDMALRDVLPSRHPQTPYAYDASHHVVSMAQPSLKSSLKYSFTRDGRDDPGAPSHGGLLAASVEVAGLGGDVQFAKGTLQLQQHFPLINDWLFLGVCGNAGWLHPFSSPPGATAAPIKNGDGTVGPRPPVSWINDRFFLGGPIRMRGFKEKGVGPRSDPSEGGAVGGDALGGDAVCSTTAILSVTPPVGLLQSLGMRGHVFCTAGSLASSADLMANGVSHMTSAARVSTGVGAALRLPFGRFEFNYAIPLKLFSQDQTRSAQFGFTFGFEG